ncbi:hypothetical protein BDV12DRAFT_199814 [Aspergillus spectabilis]
MCRTTFKALFMLLAPFTLGWEQTAFDPDSNLRLRNITGLDYYLYRWIGSYYNGTAIFHISSLTPYNEDEIVCPRLQGISKQWAYDARLAVTETNPAAAERGIINPVNVIVTASPSNFSYTPAGPGSNVPQSELERLFDSVEALNHDSPGVNYFNLSLSSDSSSSSSSSNTGPPYTLAGSSNHFDLSTLSPMQYNMSSCDGFDDVWWGSNWHDASSNGPVPFTDPAVTIIFDNTSAHFRVEGWVITNTEGDEIFWARASIEFMGTLDAARSDILNGGTTPSWTPTVGFGNNSMNLDFGSAGASNDSAVVEAEPPARDERTAADPQTSSIGISKIYTPLTLAPLCQYSVEDGHMADYRTAHLGRVAQRSPRLMMIETTSVTPEGRIMPQDLNPEIGVQIAHASHKASTIDP